MTLKISDRRRYLSANISNSSSCSSSSSSISSCSSNSRSSSSSSTSSSRNDNNARVSYSSSENSTGNMRDARYKLLVNNTGEIMKKQYTKIQHSRNPRQMSPPPEKTYSNREDIWKSSNYDHATRCRTSKTTTPATATNTSTDGAAEEEITTLVTYYDEAAAVKTYTIDRILVPLMQQVSGRCMSCTYALCTRFMQHPAPDERRWVQ